MSHSFNRSGSILDVLIKRSKTDGSTALRYHTAPKGRATLREICEETGLTKESVVQTIEKSLAGEVYLAERAENEMDNIYSL